MNSTRRMTKGMFTILLGLTVVLFASETFAQGTWVTKTPMPMARAVHAAGVVNGILYAVGGCTGGTCNGAGTVATLESYNAVTNTWSVAAAMPTARYGLAAAEVNGLLYAVAGSLPGGSGNSTSNEAYDPTTNTWTTKTAVPTEHGQGVAAGVVNGLLYVVGGYNGAGTGGATVEAYDPATNTWTTKAPMPTARGWLGVGVVNGILYAVGGVNPTNTAVFATVEAYDPATNTWTTKAPMPTARQLLAIGVVNGILYAVGGTTINGTTNMSTVEAYDPATNTWTTEASMPTARDALAIGVVNGILYAVGGYNGSFLAMNEAFTPGAQTDTPPVAQCQNTTVSANAFCQASASVDNGSHDPDGDVVTVSQDPPGPYSLGITGVTLTASDPAGQTSTCTATATVADTTPPSIGSVIVSPSVLWPPNHSMVPVTVTASASDNCDVAPTCRIISVSSNEPVNGLGDGDTAPDWVITGNLTVNLRAERSGTGSGRVYTITAQCTDASNNNSTKAVAVTVSHDQRKK